MANTPAIPVKNYVTVTASALIRILRWASKTAGVVPCILGPGGIGKSEIVAQMAAEYAGKTITMKPNANGIYESSTPPPYDEYMIDTRLGQLQVEDLTGMPIILNVISNAGDSVFTKGDQVPQDIFYREWYRCKLEGKNPPTCSRFTTYAPPAFFPRDISQSVTWFFDEINRAEKPLRQTMFQMTQDRRYGEYVMPDSVRLVLAGNWDPEIPYQVEELDPAFKSRISLLYYKGPTYKEWAPVAVKRHCHDGIVAFLDNHKDLLITPPPPDSVGGAHANPRAWFKCSDLLRASEDNEPEALMAAVAGTVGMEPAAMLIQFLKEKYDKLPDANNLTKGLEFVRKCVKNKETAKLNAFIASVSDYVRAGGGYKKDALKDFIKGIPAENSYALLQALNSCEQGFAMVTEIMGSDENTFDEELFKRYAMAKEAA